MKTTVKQYIALKAWGIFVLANAAAIWAWSERGTDISNAYRLFPLFGLIAFSTMWGHYMVWALRVWSGADKGALRTYSAVTHVVVLAAMLAHPLLLVMQLHIDGLGLPPESYKAYVGESLVPYIFLATVALMAFLLFEARKFLQEKPKVWKSVLIANHCAMLLIVLHAIKLGSSVQVFPLNILWPFYAVSLVVIYAYLWRRKQLY